MTAEAVAAKRDTLDPADVLGDGESLDALDAKIARVIAREERRAIGMLRRTGYFQEATTNDEFESLIREWLLTKERQPSPLAGLEAQREARYAGRRARDARRKALLGGFVVAQCRHKPDVHSALAPDIRDWLLSHRNAKVGARNVEALSGFLADPEHKGVSAAPAISRKATRERTHRLILLGAWVLARREELKGLRDLVADELARFLEQGQRVDRHKALLKDVLGK